MILILYITQTSALKPNSRLNLKLTLAMPLSTVRVKLWDFIPLLMFGLTYTPCSSNLKLMDCVCLWGGGGLLRTSFSRCQSQKMEKLAQDQLGLVRILLLLSLRDKSSYLSLQCREGCTIAWENWSLVLKNQSNQGTSPVNSFLMRQST